MAEEQGETMRLTAAVLARVECMVHGNRFISGTAETYNLGYGQIMLDLGTRVSCTACEGDEFLYLNVIVESTTELDKTRLREAMLAEMKRGTESDGDTSD